MSALTDLMDAMAERLRDAFSASELDIQVEPRMNLNPTPPSVDIYPGDTARETSLAGHGDISGGYVITVRARVRTADHSAGQDILLAFLDDEDDLSIASAILSDETLYGVADTVGFDNVSGFVLFPDSGGDGAFLGCLWTFTVVAN